jgi:16S rRNA (adenine1518-N6/adenine1519-N6)-dimethyltransferase
VLRGLAARHGIRPKKSLGQHFLIEPALARRVAELAEAGPEAHVLEVGAGLGSLTRALAERGAFVLAVEIDRRLVPALREVVGQFERVRIEEANALSADWGSLLDDPGPWTMAANLPYNVAVPVVMRVLEEEQRVERLLIMVQREVGERLAANPGDPQFGRLSLKVAYRAEARIVRKIPRTVFWPQPNVDSVLVSMVRRPPPVDVDEKALWTVIDRSFEQRRKTIRSAMVRLGMEPEEAARILAACEIEPRTRPERLGLPEFACLAQSWRKHRGTGGWPPKGAGS